MAETPEGNEVKTSAPEPRVVPAKADLEVNDPLLRWHAPEYMFQEKGSGWFIVAALVAILIIIGSLFLRQWLLAGVIVALSAVVYQHANRAPRELDYTITKMGVQVGERLYSYNELKSFWVVYHPPVQTLNLALTKRLAPLLIIQLADTDPASVKDILKEHLPEEDRHQEDWIDRLTRLARF
jgi:hypothetical protein